MDMWSDENLTPFMGVTAHYINVDKAMGSMRLQLRSHLIGFHEVLGRHTGQHLAQMLLHILDRLEITQKVCN